MSGLVTRRSRNARRLLARLPLIAQSVVATRGIKPLTIVVALLVIAWDIARKAGTMEDFGLDAHAYWAVDLANPYSLPAGTPDAFLYSPPFVYVFSVLHLIPWPVFHLLWLGIALVALAWLAGEWWLPMLALPPVFNEVFFGNINLLIAVVIVLGLRRPGIWAFDLLSKVTPGIGVAWFAARGDWRRLAIAVGITAAIVAVSFALTPNLWFEWIDTLRASSLVPPSESSIAIPLVPRLAVALVLLIWAGRTGRLWVLPIAVTLAIPVLWSASLSILVALVPLVRPGLERRLRQARSARIMSSAPALSAP